MAEAAEQPAQILVVDDEPDHAEVMSEALRRMGHICTLVHNLDQARSELEQGRFDLIVTDLVMDAEDDGLHVLKTAQKTQPEAETIMVTAHGDVPTSVEALKAGAFHFIEKPLDLEVFRSLCSKAIEAVQSRGQIGQLRSQLDERFGFEGILGQSPAIMDTIGRMKQIAPSNIPVLITGESGTGKELVAQAIHNNSRRKDQPFAPLNCAGLSESILEDELFGHVRGAFTGAERERQGRFEYAHKGTLFLDEVGDMPLVMQAKLLRVLESGEVIRLGDNTPRHVDVRLLSATNHDLSQMVKQGKFRQDLFFRINGAQVHLPPLRDRRPDIPILVNHFVQEFASQMDRTPPQVSEQAMQALIAAPWEGNVRQLRNAVQSMVVLAEGDRIEPRHLPPPLNESGQGAATGEAPINVSGGLSLDQIEKQAIRHTLKLAGGNREKAAQMLGIGERTLYRKLREYNIK